MTKAKLADKVIVFIQRFEEWKSQHRKTAVSPNKLEYLCKLHGTLITDDMNVHAGVINLLKELAEKRNADYVFGPRCIPQKKNPGTYYVSGKAYKVK